MKCGSKFGPVPENQGAVGRAGWLASFLDLPGANFFCEKPLTHENSLNFANTCLKVVDTRRVSVIRRICEDYVRGLRAKKSKGD